MGFYPFGSGKLGLSFRVRVRMSCKFNGNAMSVSEDQVMQSSFMKHAFSHARFAVEVREVLGMSESVPLNRIAAHIRNMKLELEAFKNS